MLRSKDMILRGSIIVTLVAVCAGPTAGASPDAANPPARTIVGDNLKNPDYRGRFADEGRAEEGRVLIKITRQNTRGKPLEGAFLPKEITLDCFGGTVAQRRDRWPVFAIHFYADGTRFEGQDYDIDDETGYETVLLFHGRLTQDGARARGTIVIMDNPTRAAEQPYCTTDGPRPWKAKRVHEGI